MSKGNVVVALVAFFVIAMSCGSVQADPVAFDFDGLWSWGTSYTFDGTSWNAGTASNPSNPWDGSVSQNLPNGVTKTADSKEDTFGVARINTITDTASHTTLFDRTTAANELTVLFYGFDDIYANGNTASNVDLRSNGGHVLVYRGDDTSKNYNPANPPNAATDRTAVNQMNKITDGTLMLDLVAHPLTDGINTFTMEENFNFDTFRGTGSTYFDVVGGEWASLYNTNGLLDGSDINFAFSSFPAVVGEPGVLSDRNFLVKGAGEETGGDGK